MEIKNLYSRIVRELEDKSNAKSVEKEKIYFKKEGYKSYGIKIPDVKRLIRSFNSQFEQLTFEQRLSLVKLLYKSGFGEEDRIANSLLVLSLKDLTPQYFDYLDGASNLFTNWDTTDDFSINVLQPLLLKYSKETLKLLKRWNNSKNIWKRRASVVVFVRRIGESGKFTNEVLDLCDNLIWDKEDLIQKAVGWALKDSTKGAKKRIIKYVKKLRRRGVSSVITLYAIRNLKDKEREEVLKVKSV